MDGIKKGTYVRIRPEWQDPDEAGVLFVAVDDEEKGRVSIALAETSLLLPPVQTVTVEMVEVVHSPDCTSRKA